MLSSFRHHFLPTCISFRDKEIGKKCLIMEKNNSSKVILSKRKIVGRPHFTPFLSTFMVSWRTIEYILSGFYDPLPPLFCCFWVPKEVPGISFFCQRIIKAADRLFISVILLNTFFLSPLCTRVLLFFCVCLYYLSVSLYISSFVFYCLRLPLWIHNWLFYFSLSLSLSPSPLSHSYLSILKSFFFLSL